MAKLNMKIKVQESEAQIARMILGCLQSELNIILRDSANSLKPKVQTMLYTEITNDDTWQSLHGGQLQGEFGLENTSGLNDILDIWIKNINVDYKPVTIIGSILKGGFILDMIKEDWSDVLASSSAVVITKNNQVLPM